MVYSAEEEQKALVNRLSRIEGQIAAIKRSLYSGDADCEKTLQLLKAANQAIKKFGEAYISLHLEKCTRAGMTKKDIEKDLKKAISAAFSF
ncbi:MAG: metal-sensitive transcriptional regulator [Leptospiraceae bacterium]|nr:metal-sensitive transcriptional regulator [Leptospiraceae bacterium]